MKTQVIEQETDHPLEKVFEIEESSTVVERLVPVPEEVVSTEQYDIKDEEIDKQFQEIYEAAMTAFEATTTSLEQIEPKFRARNEEVAVQYLNAALGAAREKSLVKQHKDKVAVAKVKATTPSTVNQNLIVAERNELLKQILGKK